MEELSLFERLESLISEKKDEEAVLMVRSPLLKEMLGDNMTRNIESSIASGRREEALELVSAVKSFLKTVSAKLKQASRPHFGIAPLPDTDW